MTLTEERKTTINEKPLGLSIREISLDRIQTNPSCLRREFPEDGIEELARSIEEIGLLQPILLKAVEDGFIVVAGERRLKAYQTLKDRYSEGYDYIPSNILESSVDTDVLALSENIQREGLRPIDECEAIYKLIGTTQKTYAGIGKLLGKSEDYVERRIRYRRLNHALKSCVASFSPESSFYQKLDRLALSKVLILKPLISHWTKEECYDFLKVILEEEHTVRQIKTALSDLYEMKLKQRMGQETDETTYAPIRQTVERDQMPANDVVLNFQGKESRVHEQVQEITIKDDFWETFYQILKTNLNVEIDNPKGFQGGFKGLLAKYRKVILEKTAI